MFLTDDEIIELTGYKQRASQIKWLRFNGIMYLIGRDGKPRILESHIKELFGVSQSKSSRRRAEPNEKALDQYMGL